MFPVLTNLVFPQHANDESVTCSRRRKGGLRTALGILLGTASLMAGAAGYDSLSIVSPASEATVHDNRGRVDIDTMLVPPLRTEDGDRFVFIVDGVPMPPMRNGFLALNQLGRGGHTLQVQVVDAAGSALISSEPRTFYLWQASALTPEPTQTPMQPHLQPMQLPSGPPTRPPGL